VVSEVLRAAPAQQVENWLNRRFAECAVSSVTVMELLAGATALPQGKRRQLLENAIARLVRRFGPRVYAFDLSSARAAAHLVSIARAIGRGSHQFKRKFADLQIAGIASAYGLELATRNVGDFAGLGLTLIDPWNSP
jgi:predicted nucleic acid-binding protein